MIYLVEFVGVLQNYGQHVGVGLTKKTTPHQPYEVASSRVDKPTWVWRQDYNDEIQVFPYSFIFVFRGRKFNAKAIC